MRIAIAGAGAIALASAAWLTRQGHAVSLWAPRGPRHNGPSETTLLRSTGLLEATHEVTTCHSAQQLAGAADVLLLALPVNAHRSVVDALLPHLRNGQTVIVSAMGSLSALYLFEAARAAGRDITVLSWGTTALTARRSGPASVQVMTQRALLGVSALPRAREAEGLSLCRALFGNHFAPQGNALAAALSNTNPIAHVPLLLANWTRMERAEAWPQYHYMTPRVAALIERLDAERLAAAQVFGLQLRSIEQHFAQSFGTRADTLADIAAELHAKRGGPPGPTSLDTRYLEEDVPFGLVFQAEMARIAGVPAPATRTMIDAACLLAGHDYAEANDLLAPLSLAQATRESLTARVEA